MSETDEAAGQAGTQDAIMASLQPQVSTKRLVLWGILLWAAVGATLWTVPSLHEGGRSWWKWVPVAGIVLGGIGYGYLARGRGNAAAAD